MNTIAPRDSRQYHGENQHPGKLPHPEVGCPLALDADDGAKPHALARDVRRVASIDLRVRAQASRVRPLGRPTQCVACPAPRTARYGSTARGRGGAGGCHCADILVALRCLLGDQLPAHTARAESQPCEHRTTRTSAVRAVREARLARGRQWLQGLALAGNACSNAVLGDLRTRGSQRRSRATRPGQHSQPKRYPTRLCAPPDTSPVSQTDLRTRTISRPGAAVERPPGPARPWSPARASRVSGSSPSPAPPTRQREGPGVRPRGGPAARRRPGRRAVGRASVPRRGKWIRTSAPSRPASLLHTPPHTRLSRRPRARARAPGGRGRGRRRPVRT